MNNEGLLLLRTIIDHPGEDTPRLVYADWLEENGEQTRAEFIRDQIESVSTTCDLWDRVPFPVQSQMRHREPLIQEITGLPAYDNTLSGAYPIYAKQCTPTYRRGFVDEIDCKMGCWLEFGKEIMSWHPVRRVTITDRWPSCPCGEAKSFSWWQRLYLIGERRYEHLNLKEGIIALVATNQKRVRGLKDEFYWSPSNTRGAVSFASEEDAMEALSDACIQWAKENPNDPS